MEIVQKLRSLELYLAAHPDCEINSECADRLSDVQELLKEITDNSHQIEKLEAHLQDEINEFSVLGYEPNQYQLGYNSAINDIMEILKPTPKI